MTFEQHFYAVDAGFQQTDSYNKLHDLILEPGAKINRAYRSARTALEAAFLSNGDRVDNLYKIDDIFIPLKDVVEKNSIELLIYSGLLGADLGNYLLNLYYEDISISDPVIDFSNEVRKIIDIVDSQWRNSKMYFGGDIESSINSIEILLGNGVDTLGIFTAASINRQLELATMQKAIGIENQVIDQSIKSLMYKDQGSFDSSNKKYLPKKQVVAAVDPRTTLCCLGAHGQIQPVDTKFTLTGTNFAPEMDWPPFHWNCRSTVVFSFDNTDLSDELTKAMKMAADDELAWRNDNWKTMDRRPASDKRDLGSNGKRWRDFLRESEIGNSIMNLLRKEMGLRKRYFYKPEIPSSALISTRATDYLRSKNNY